jgi:hypothetical protein
MHDDRLDEFKTLPTPTTLEDALTQAKSLGRTSHYRLWRMIQPDAPFFEFSLWLTSMADGMWTQWVAAGCPGFDTKKVDHIANMIGAQGLRKVVASYPECHEALDRWIWDTYIEKVVTA